MRRALPLFACALVVGAALLCGYSFEAHAGLTFAVAGMAAAVDRPAFGWGRKREPTKTFSNVGVSQTAYSIVPRYPRTLLGIIIQLGGTTFTKAMVSRIELFLGEKSIWGPVTGTQLDNIEQYVMGEAEQRSDFHLALDFTFPNIKEIGGEMLGGIDMTTLPDGMLRLEVDIGAATAPTLRADTIWGAPQGNGQLGPLMHKLTRRTYPAAAAGDFYPDLDFRRALVLREFWFSTVANAGVAAAAGAGVAFVNSGNGAMGAITVTARTPTGRFRLRFIEPAANAGTFVVYDPNGREVGGGNVAVAFAGGGLAFTLADGAADFVAGDGFTLDVLPLNTDQNINEVEIKKNEDFVWKRIDRAARFEQYRFGRQPLTQLYVADFILDNHIDSILDTADATTLDHRINLTAGDTLTLVAQTLARPVNS